LWEHVTVLTSGDLRRALDAAGTWHETETVSELAVVATASLHRLIGADGVGWNEVDLGGKTVRAVTSPVDYFAPEHAEALDRLVHQHPIVQHVAATHDTSARLISEFVSTRQFHRLELYADFFRPLGAEDLLAVIVQASPVIIGVAFTRPARTFTGRDRALLDLLRPHLAAAYANVAARETLARGLDGRLVVRLARDGSIAEHNALLAAWFGETPRQLEPGLYERDAATLRVRRIDGDPPVLVLHERRFTPDPRRARDLGLTTREAEIVALAGRGLTDEEISRELFVSVRTVAKHLQHAYEKLGVHSRTDAAALLLGD
jgi:DNA-binding CsgD family transcriptional regulator